MKSEDKLGIYLKGLKREEPSDHFTRGVMDRIVLESKSIPAEYRPLITRRTWVLSAITLCLLLAGLGVFQTYFPGAENPSWITLYKVDYSSFLQPFHSFSAMLAKIPVSYAFGFLAISMLLFAERLLSSLARR